MNRERDSRAGQVSATRSAIGVRLAAALFAFVVAVPGCTTDSKLREQDLSRLRSWLPGHYDNLPQVEADIATGIVDVREPVAIVVVPVNPGIMGDTVFYVQQSDAMNPQRVLSQRLHRFEKGPDDQGILHTILELKQPAQWLAAASNPDVLRAIVPDDLRAASGCALLWKYADGKFTATCPVAPAAPAGTAAVPVELTESELKLADLSFNGRARAVASRAADPAYRFERR